MENPPPPTPGEDPSPNPPPGEEEKEKAPGIPPLPFPFFPGRAQPAAPAPAGSPCQKGSCGGKISDQVGQNADQLGKINALLNALDLAAIAAMNAKLDVINTKLGPQIPGEGISGFLKKLAKWMQFDRILNVLTWMNTLHNAYMLSNSLSDTLFSAIDNIIGLFIKDMDGQSIDTKGFFGSKIDEFAARLFGLQNWKEMKTTWKNWSRIYQAAANIANTVRSMIDSLRNITEFIAENTGKIGNALKKFGAIGEKAFPWMPEQVNAQSVWMQRLQNLEEAASGIEMVTSEAVSIKDNLKELTTQKEEFEKSIEELAPKERPNNLSVKEAQDIAKLFSQGAIISEFDKEADE